MHTLPLPNMPTEAATNAGTPKPETLPASTINAATLPAPTLNAGSLNSESRTPNSESRIPNSEPVSRHGEVSHFYLAPQQLRFLSQVAPAAINSERVYGIPACVTVAQAILESATVQFGWGTSVLFRVANNPFGIKYCHLGAGDWGLGSGASGLGVGDAAGDAFRAASGAPCVPCTESAAASPQPAVLSPHPPAPIVSDYGHFDVQTWEIENGQKKLVTAEFQRFPNLDAAFTAHARLLCGPRYRPAFEVRDDWKQFAERLGPKTSPLDTEHCGYSTNPSYSAELIKLVNLYRLDDPRALQWFATGKDPGLGVRD